MFLNVDNVGVERMSSGRLFQATGPAKENARLLSCSLVLGATKSPQAAERRAERLGTVETGVHISFRFSLLIDVVVRALDLRLEHQQSGDNVVIRWRP